MPSSDPKLCECGCGQPAPIAKKTAKRYGHIKGEPVRFIAGHQFYSSKPEYEVDPETGCWEWQRHRDRFGYGKVKGGLAHRRAYEREHGAIESGLHIDHICRNPGCVNPAHLRAVTAAENAAHRDAAGNRGSSSRYRGVWFDKRVGKWAAAVTINRTVHRLGWFEDEDDAGKVAADYRAANMPGSSEFVRPAGPRRKDGPRDPAV